MGCWCSPGGLVLLVIRNRVMALLGALGLGFTLILFYYMIGFVNKLGLAQVRSVGNIDFHPAPLLKVVLNRPKALNSLNLQMIRDLASELHTLSAAPAFWLEGAGGKAFCAGGDVKALFDKEATVADRLSFFREEFSLDYRISQLKALQIANWDGIVMGGGFGVSAFAPFIIATEHSMFAMPQAKLGFFTDVGSSYLLARLRSNIGNYLAMTGSRLKGEEVYLSGLAHYYIPRESVQVAYEEINDALPSSKDAKETIRTVLSKYHRPSGRKTIAHEEQIKEIFGLGSIQAIYKRVAEDSDKFCVGMTKALNEQCPLSIGIVHRLVKEAAAKSLKQCFETDYHICQHSIVDPNFAEGVRTVLVEKGSEPKWSHKHIYEVTDAQVSKYFESPSHFEHLPV